MNFRHLLLATVLVLSACAGTPAQIASKAAPQSLRLAPERYIVAGIDNVRAAPPLRAGSSPRGYDGIAAYGPSARAQQIMLTLASDYGLREVTAWPIDPLHMHCAVLEVPADVDRGALLAKMERDPRIRLAQPLQSFETRTQSYNDPYVGLQRGFAQMDVADAHTLSQGDGVRIAVIDTGADTSHPDLRGVVSKARNFVDQDMRQFNRDRHGTEIVGVIAALANNREGIVGIAPRAQLWVFKSCWQLQPDSDAARCNSFTLAQGLVAALDAGVQVVNLSLAGPEDPLLHSLIQEGVHRGIIFVGAASASGATAQDGFLHQSGVIEVAGIDSPRQSDGRLYAPGAEILTLLPGGRYDFASGASIATAHVTGAVALILALHPTLSSTAVRELFAKTSEQFAGADGSPGDAVDACAALVAASGRGLCKHFEPRQDRVAGRATSPLAPH